MVKVLHAFTLLNNAGTEKVIYNICKNVDKEKVKFDFLVFRDGNNEKIFEDLGANIYKITFDSEKETYKRLCEFFKEHKYDVIHIHMCGQMYILLKAAKQANIKCRIIHSHNARQDLPKLAQLYKIYKEIISIDKYATDYFACSEVAAKWMFPLKYKNTEIVHNGINITNFLYREDVRVRIRKQLGIQEDEKLIINVARLDKQKNQDKILEIAKCMKNEKVKFLIVGEGKLKQELNEKIKLYKIEDKVTLYGNSNNVNELLMASDLFLFTSIFEGLGIVLIEAQASGLKVLVSQNVPNDAKIHEELFYKMNLKESNEIWAKEILNLLNSEYNRKELSENCMQSDYNMKKVGQKLEEFYMNKGGKI